MLDHGLVALPPSVGAARACPSPAGNVGSFGAVLHVQWSWWPEHPEGDALISEVEVFRRHGAAWQPADGSGGGGWPDQPFERPPLAPMAVAMEGCTPRPCPTRLVVLRGRPADRTVRSAHVDG